MHYTAPYIYVHCICILCIITYTTQLYTIYTHIHIYIYIYIYTGNVLAVSTGDNKVTLWKQTVDQTWVEVCDIDPATSASTATSAIAMTN